MSTDVSSRSQPPSEGPTAASTSRRFRWKTGLVILLIGLAAMAAMWFGAPDRTLQVFVTGYVLAPATCFALLLWWLFFSGLSWRTRIVGVVCAAAAVGLFFALFVNVGFRGAMEPQFAFRWSETPEERAAAYWKNQPLAKVAAADAVGEMVEITEEDWPRFRGARGDGIVRGESIRTDWDAAPPKLVWKHPVGLGWSSFAVVGRSLYTQEQREEQEAVVCYDAGTGKPIWVQTDEARLSTSLGGVGPLATPTVHDSRVYALGGTGILNCLDAATGRKIWSTDVLEDAGAKGAWVEWGLSGSPLIVDELVIVNTGINHDGEPASLAAYNRETGKRVWAGGTTKASYTSPTPATIGNVPQVLIVDATEVAGYEPATGRKLWRTGWENNQSIHCCAPILLEDETLFVSSGYAKGSARLKIAQQDGAWSCAVLEETPNQFKLKFNDGIYSDGHVFGLDEGILSCVDALTLKRKWKKGRYKYGQILLFEQDGVLLVQAEDGTLHLVEATTKPPRELGRFKAIEGTCWNQPAYSRGRLYVRSEREAACYEIGGSGN